MGTDERAACVWSVWVTTLCPPETDALYVCVWLYSPEEPGSLPRTDPQPWKSQGKSGPPGLSHLGSLILPKTPRGFRNSLMGHTWTSLLFLATSVNVFVICKAQKGSLQTLWSGCALSVNCEEILMFKLWIICLSVDWKFLKAQDPQPPRKGRVGTDAHPTR